MRRGALGALTGLSAAAGVVAAGLSSAPAAPTDAGRWIAHPAGLTPRSEHAVARVGDAAYAVGGFGARNATLASVDRLDLRTGRVRPVPAMPLALNHPAAAGWRGRLYVVGGYTANAALAGETKALLRYDPRTRRWRRLRDMPTARAALTAGVVGDRLYAAGGAAGGRPLDTLEVYDLRRDRWTAGPPLRRAREHLGGAVAGGRFYVLAGRDGTGNLADAERFDPRRGRWERLPAVPTARSGVAAATVDGLVVLAGGETLVPGGSTFPQVQALSPRTRRWRSLAPMPAPRHGFGAVGRGHSLWVLAGGPTPGFSLSGTVRELRLR